MISKQDIFEQTCSDLNCDLIASLLPYVDPTIGDQYIIKDACENGQIAVVKILLTDDRVDPSYTHVLDENEEEIYHSSYPSHSAFTLSVLMDHSEIVSILLKDPRVNPKSDDSWCVLIAATNNCIKTMKVLIKDGRIDPSVRGNLALSRAIKKGYTEIAKLLLKDSRVDICSNSYRPLRKAMKHKNKTMIKLLLSDDRIKPKNNSSNPDADHNNTTNLCKSSLQYPKTIMKILSTVDTIDLSFLEYVITNDGFELMKLLLESNKIDACSNNYYLIIFASKEGQYHIVHLMLEQTARKKRYKRANKIAEQYGYKYRCGIKQITERSKKIKI